jgi:hypothetical protein
MARDHRPRSDGHGVRRGLPLFMLIDVIAWVHAIIVPSAAGNSGAAFANRRPVDRNTRQR